MSNTFSDGLNITSGKVGVGTASPAVTLDVIGTGSFALAEASLSQGIVQLGVDSGGNTGGELMFHTDDYIGLRCADSGALSFVVKPDGKVGVGTTDPAQVLDVIGIGSFALAESSQSQGIVQVGVDSGGDPGGELMFHTDDYVGLRCADSGALSLAVKPSGNVGIGTVNPNTQLTVEGAVTLKEQAAADSDTAAYGQLWVKTATPNELYFTDDAGNDVQLVTGGAAAGGGGGISSIVTKTTTYTATTSDDVILCDGTFTLTLYAASGNSGEVLYLKNISTGTITIDADGSETIDGALAKYLAGVQYESLTIVCDGSDWHII